MIDEKMIAVCDHDHNYALGLSGALEKALFGRYGILAFTDMARMNEYAAEHTIDVAIISESTYLSDEAQAVSAQLIILTENADFAEENAILIDRFQSREDLTLSVIRSLPEGLEGCSPRRIITRPWKVIGVYSPIRRCLQTSFALALGQMMAMRRKVLYMNFENYSGFSGWFNSEFKGDMVDLLYYFDCEREKLPLRIPTLIHKLGDLDILPPSESAFDTYDVSGKRWVDLFETIRESTDYEYLILDLTDSMNGLLEVMEYCDRIYTLVRGDQISAAKMAQYEKWMVDHSKADVIGKTVRFSLPELNDMPVRPDMLTHCELAGYVKAVMNEDAYKEAG